MNLINRCLKAIDNRLFHKDKVFRFDDSLIYEREDSVIFFVCGVANSTDEAFIFRLEGDDLDVWLHTCTYQESLSYFQSIREEFEDLPEEGPGSDQGEKPKLKSVELSTLEKINRSKFGKFGHTLVDEVTLTLATMENEETGESYHLFIEGEEVRDTLSPVPLVSVAELIDTLIHLIETTGYAGLIWSRSCVDGFETMTHTQRVLMLNKLLNGSDQKGELLGLIESSFFKHMTQDKESAESREALDYILSLL